LLNFASKIALVSPWRKISFTPFFMIVLIEYISFNHNYEYSRGINKIKKRQFKVILEWDANENSQNISVTAVAWVF